MFRKTEKVLRENDSKRMNRGCKQTARRKPVARDTYLYHLKQGRKIKYTGITSDPLRREREHRNAGIRFTHMYVHPYPSSRETALKREGKYER